MKAIHGLLAPILIAARNEPTSSVTILCSRCRLMNAELPSLPERNSAGRFANLSLCRFVRDKRDRPVSRRWLSGWSIKRDGRRKAPDQFEQKVSGSIVARTASFYDRGSMLFHTNPKRSIDHGFQTTTTRWLGPMISGPDVSNGEPSVHSRCRT